MLAKEAADEELSKLDTLPAPQFRTSQQIELLLNGIVTEEKLIIVYVELCARSTACFQEAVPL